MKVFQILVLMIGLALTAHAQASDKAVLSGTVYSEISGKILLRPLEALPKGENKSKLCGTMFDELRAVIPGVIIKAKSNKKVSFQTTSDKDGNFEMELPDGLYKIIIKHSGFKKVIMKKQSLPYNVGSCRNYILKSTVKGHQIT
jgi:hypothetical protein